MVARSVRQATDVWSRTSLDRDKPGRGVRACTPNTYEFGNEDKGGQFPGGRWKPSKMPLTGWQYAPIA
jgi:hypothetical protein